MVGLSFVSVLAAVQLAHAACLAPAGTIKPVVAPGYSYQVVANGLSRPRGLAFDSYGRLLVVQSGSGSITSHRITTVNGCIVAQKIADVVTNAGLNHAIQVSGGTLYSSTQDKAIAWTYNLTTGVASNSRTIVSGMAGTDHSTRPLQLSKAAPGTIIIGRGSLSNLDLQAASPNGGTAQVRAFDMTKRNYAYDWFEGRLLAWGVRNEVGLAEHPVTGGIYGVENSADQIVRGGKDVSNDNPGEELNYFGKLSDPVRAADYTSYYGYPYCLAAWGVEALPNNSGLTVGSHFGFDPSPNYLNNNSRTDAWCAAHTIKPRLTFQAHQAPLDIKFVDSAGTKAWVSFHGSWDRQVPIGYHVAEILFANGQPVEPYTSKKGENTVILGNADYTKCPNNCLRPVAMAVDKFGRVFVSSDATGEIYMITKTR